MSEIVIRKIAENEIDQLEDLLYEAVYQPDEQNPIPRSVIHIPEVYAYIDAFGTRKDDCCFNAADDGEIVGAVWVRIIAGSVKGFGNINDQTPEFAISLYKPYRNRGIGTRLMHKMIDYLQLAGYQQASLSVQKANYALKLYQKVGFEIIGEHDEDYLMLLKLN